MLSVPAKESKIERTSFKDSVTVLVRLDSEDMVLVAYNQSRTPSIMVTSDSFSEDTKQNQSINFQTITLDGYEGYRIWCCEIVNDEMRVCLVR